MFSTEIEILNNARQRQAELTVEVIEGLSDAAAVTEHNAAVLANAESILSHWRTPPDFRDSATVAAMAANGLTALQASRSTWIATATELLTKRDELADNQEVILDGRQLLINEEIGKAERVKTDAVLSVRAALAEAGVVPESDPAHQNNAGLAERNLANRIESSPKVTAAVAEIVRLQGIAASLSEAVKIQAENSWNMFEESKRFTAQPVAA
jgi:hypothetical protein